MSARPFKVSVQGAKPRKGEAANRYFANFDAAVEFAAAQARAQWRPNGSWLILDRNSLEMIHVAEDGEILKEMR